MDRLLTLLLLAIGSLSIIFGLLLLPSSNWALVIISAGALAIYLSINRDIRWQREIRVQQQQEAKQQLQEFTNHAWIPGDSLTLNSTARFYSIVLVLLTLGLFHPEIHVKLIFMVLLLPSIILFTINFNKPRLEMDHGGFCTPMHGNVAWCNVTRITLQTVQTRYSQYYYLRFQIKDFAAIYTGQSLLLRLMAWFGLGALRRDVITVMLSNDAGRAETEAVFQFANYLWHKNRSVGWAKR